MDNNIEIQNALNLWQNEQARFDKVLAKISDEQLLLAIAPKKNTGIYLLGHLMVVADGMMPLLGFGDAQYVHLIEAFLKLPDYSGQIYPAPEVLRKMYFETMEKLNTAITALPHNEWLTKHNSVTAEDFVNEPHRNKLSVLLSRATHQAYHGGQIAMLA
jgi:hypothetical protein